MNIAYLRVSTDKQHIENQKNEIARFADSRGIGIDRWHKEVISGTKSSKHRQLGGILRRVKKGDAIIVSEMSRLSRKMFEIISILHMCIEKKVTLYSVKEGYVIGDDINSKFMGVAFSLSAEIERNLISMRTKEALAQRKAQGIKLGRPAGSGRKRERLLENREDILSSKQAGEPVVSIAARYGVSRGTIFNFLKGIS